MISDEDIAKAWDAIARTPAGALIYRHLQKVLMGTLETTDGGALLRHDGRRTLARDLMAMMAKGIDDSGGRTESSEPGSRASERPVVFSLARGVSVARGPRGAGRRVSPEPEPE